MKDLPHHIKKLNRRILRSIRKEGMEDLLPDIPTWPDSERQKRKKAKIKMRNECLSRPIVKKSEEERNKIMKKGRVPIFDRHNAEPKHTRPSKKKTPKI
jgi:hypothetical protein